MYFVDRQTEQKSRSHGTNVGVYNPLSDDFDLNFK